MRGEGVIVFGAGGAGRNVVRAIGAGCVRGVVDNDPGKWGGMIGGVSVAGPDRIDPVGEERILIASVFAADIYDQLLDMGVAPERIAIASTEMMNGVLLPSPRCLWTLAAVALLLIVAAIAGIR